MNKNKKERPGICSTDPDARMMILIASVISLRHLVKDAHNHRIMSKSKKILNHHSPMRDSVSP